MAVQKVWQWLTGKKTYIAGIAMVLLAVIATWYGLLPPVQIAILLAVAFGFVGVAHADSRKAQMLIELVTLAKKAADDKKKTGALNLGPLASAVVQDAVEIASEPPGGTESK